MRRTTNTAEMIFNIYSTHNSEMPWQNLYLFLDSIGMSSKKSTFPRASLVFSEFKAVYEKLHNDIDIQNKKLLFDQYAQCGMINREQLREMLTNHLEDLNRMQVECLLDDCFRNEETVDFATFQKLNIF